MWILLNDAWFSVVKDLERPGNLLVRSRRGDDLQRIFGVEELITPLADYGWRISVPAQMVCEIINDRLLGIDYPNFKNSVRDPDLHAAYSSVWATGYHLQNNPLYSSEDTFYGDTDMPQV